MIDFLSGKDITVVIPLIVDGVPVIPTAGSVTYTLYDHGLLPIVGYIDVPVTTTSPTSSLSIPLPQSVNQIAVGKKFERRRVVVNLVSSGKPHIFQFTYRLVPLLNHSVTTASVRDFLGVRQTELPDEAIDLVQAYFEVEGDIAPTPLDTILSSGTISEIAANEAIRMKAVINVLPSIRQRIAQMESNGVLQFQRPNMEKLDRLEQEAWNRYSMARDRAANLDESNLTFVVTTTDADPITGA